MLAFYEARIKRIVPLYWLATLCMFFSPLISKTIGWSSNFSIKHLLASLFFVGGYHNPAFDITYPVLPPGWTLNFEMFFYFIFGLGLMLGTARRSLLLTIPAIVTLVVLGWIFHSGNSIIRFYFDPIMLEFVYGLIIAYAVLNGLTLPRLFALAAILAGCILLIFIKANADNRFACSGLPLALLVLGAVSLELRSKAVWKTRLKIIGDASYSIYLSHQFVQSFVAMIWIRVPFLKSGSYHLWYIAAACIFAIIGGLVCYYFVELPLTKWVHAVRFKKLWASAS